MCIKYKSKFVYERLKDLIEKLPMFDIFPIMAYRNLCKSKFYKVMVNQYFGIFVFNSEIMIITALTFLTHMGGHDGNVVLTGNMKTLLKNS